MSAALFVDTWAICTLRSFRKVLTFIQEWVEKTCMLYTFNLVFSFLLSVKICLSFFVQQFPTFLPKDLSCRALSSLLKKNKRLAWVLRSLSEVIWAAWVALGEVMVVTVMSPVRSQCTEDSTESSHSSLYLFSALFSGGKYSGGILISGYRHLAITRTLLVLHLFSWMCLYQVSPVWWLVVSTVGMQHQLVIGWHRQSAYGNIKHTWYIELSELTCMYMGERATAKMVRSVL